MSLPTTTMTYRLLRGGAALLARQRPAAALQQSRCRSGPGGRGGKTTSTALEDTKAKKAQAEALAKRGGVLTAEEEDCGTPELPRYFKDPDREKRMISAKGTSAMAGRREANYTKDGFDFPTPIRHGLGDIRTPHPGPYPEFDGADEDAEGAWDASRGSPDERDHLEYRYSIPNYETENFSFDREAGILQEEADERRFYERVVKPKTSHLPFRQQQEPSRDIDYEVSKDPVEWAYVERLVPSKTRTIKRDFEYGKEYPSGFVPPNPAMRSEAEVYRVGRTRNCMLPVVTKYTRVADTVETSLHKCEGNLYQLREDLDAFLWDKYEQKFPCQVAELYGRLKYRGDFEQEFKEFLIAKGF